MTRRRLLTTGIALAAVVATGTAPATAAPGSAPARPSAPGAAGKLPRTCLAEFTGTNPSGVVTAAVFGEGRFEKVPYAGWTISPAPRFVEPARFGVDGDEATMTSLVVLRDGTLQSVRARVSGVGGVVGPNDLTPGARAVAPTAETTPAWRADKPVRIGHGWNAVRDMALPGTDTAPYLFAVLGTRLNRYTLRADAKNDLVVRTGPHAATAGFGGVRALTWTRETTVRGVRADVLIGLDGARLREYTVPRKVNPRVTTRTLASRGWGGVSHLDAGVCVTGSGAKARVTHETPVLARVGRSVRLYVDRDNRNGSGTDIANHGQVGTWP